MMFIFVSSTFVACSDDDDKISGKAAALVGVWGQKYDRWSIIGFKITADGKAYYNEWGEEEGPDFSRISPGNVNVTESTIRFSHPKVPGYFEEYNYVLSEDGKTLTLTLTDWEDEDGATFIGLNGTFTKYE